MNCNCAFKFDPHCEECYSDAEIEQLGNLWKALHPEAFKEIPFDLTDEAETAQSNREQDHTDEMEARL